MYALIQQIHSPVALSASATDGGMSSFLQLVLALAVLITVAKVGGALSTRLKQPAVAGRATGGDCPGAKPDQSAASVFFYRPKSGDSGFSHGRTGRAVSDVCRWNRG